MRVVMIAVIVLVTAAVLAIVLFFWRLRTLGRRVGSFECAVRTNARWTAGIAAYTRDHLDWYEVVSLSLQPCRRWRRHHLEITYRRPVHVAGSTESLSEVGCTINGEQFQLVAEDGALDGLRSWLEAAPPDPRTSRIV